MLWSKDRCVACFSLSGTRAAHDDLHAEGADQPAAARRAPPVEESLALFADALQAVS